MIFFAEIIRKTRKEEVSISIYKNKNFSSRY